jgi:hypothetical protein
MKRVNYSYALEKQVVHEFLTGIDGVFAKVGYPFLL